MSPASPEVVVIKKLLVGQDSPLPLQVPLRKYSLFAKRQRAEGPVFPWDFIICPAHQNHRFGSPGVKSFALHVLKRFSTGVQRHALTWGSYGASSLGSVWEEAQGHKHLPGSEGFFTASLACMSGAAAVGATWTQKHPAESRERKSALTQHFWTSVFLSAKRA